MYVGYHAVFDPDFEDAIRYAADHGFDYVQFDLNVPRFFLDDLSPRRIEEVRRCAADRHVGIGLHAPADNVSLFTDYPRVRKGILEQHELILDRANDLGARHLTVHPGSPPSFRKAGEPDDGFRREHREHYAAVLSDNLRWIAERSRGVLVCVENFGLVGTAFGVVERLAASGCPVWTCWDIAKSMGQPEAEVFYRRTLPLLREIHVHNVDPGGRQHGVVGEGSIRFERYLDVLRRPDVAVTIEVRPREAALASRRRLDAMVSAHDAGAGGA